MPISVFWNALVSFLSFSCDTLYWVISVNICVTEGDMVIEEDAGDGRVNERDPKRGERAGPTPSYGTDMNQRVHQCRMLRFTP